MIPSLLLGHDLSTAELYAITTAPDDATTRRRYRRWVEHRRHRVAAASAAELGVVTSRPSTAPLASTAPEPGAAPRRRRFRSPAPVRA